MGKRAKFGLILIVACALCGCDPLTTHKVMTTLLDGVPSMPPADQYCQEYHQQATAEELEAEKASLLGKKKEGASIHPPYRSKNCNDCHDRSKETGLVRPRDQLCFMCHPDIAKKGGYVHGPVATGACLSCHDPHSSNFPALLKTERGAVCGSCHREKRVAENLHSRVGSSGLVCSDCHDPHSGSAKYFLR